MRFCAGIVLQMFVYWVGEKNIISLIYGCNINDIFHLILLRKTKQNIHKKMCITYNVKKKWNKF